MPPLADEKFDALVTDYEKKRAALADVDRQLKAFEPLATQRDALIGELAKLRAQLEGRTPPASE